MTRTYTNARVVLVQLLLLLSRVEQQPHDSRGVLDLGSRSALDVMLKESRAHLVVEECLGQAQRKSEEGEE